MKLQAKQFLNSVPSIYTSRCWRVNLTKLEI